MHDDHGVPQANQPCRANLLYQDTYVPAPPIVSSSHTILHFPIKFGQKFYTKQCDVDPFGSRVGSLNRNPSDDRNIAARSRR